MNVLHINQSDIYGGASIAGYRLHQGLLTKKINSRLLVGSIKSPGNDISNIPRKHRSENQLHRLTSTLGLNYLHLLGSFDIPKHIFYKEADILNFHNLHSDYFNYLALPKLTEIKPAVFTLHDMWSFTGHCAYSFDCSRWRTGCGQCPYLDTYPAVKKDSTCLEWKIKDWTYQRSNLTIVTPSQWLMEQAQKSLLNRFSIHHIPYGIDTEAYRPIDQEYCRLVLGIPANRKVLLFVAQNLRDYRKGSDLLLKALEALPVSLKAELILLILGDGGEEIGKAVDIQTLALGYVSGDHLKAIVYSAADLFVFPTRADNLPLVLQESMACATPMVSFEIGGVPDLVRPKITGYLAEAGNDSDFCNGIVELLEDNNLRNCMRQKCRTIAVKEYSLELQAQRYITLYQKVL